MAWVRYESAFVKHPKVQGIPEALRPGAIALHVAAAGYCADLLTDGLVPVSAVPSIARDAGIQRPKKYLEALLHAGLFIDTGPTRKVDTSTDNSAQTAVFDRDSSGETAGFSGPIARERSHIQRTFDVAIDPKERSYLIHDYLEYNPSRHAVMEERRRASERQRLKRQREKQGVLDTGVTGEHHGRTSQTKSQRESQWSRARMRAARSHPSERGNSLSEEKVNDEPPATSGVAPTPAHASTNGSQALNRARAFVERVGREYPSWPVLADELYATTALGKPHFPDLTDDDLLELRELHAALLDPEPDSERA